MHSSLYLKLISVTMDCCNSCSCTHIDILLTLATHQHLACTLPIISLLLVPYQMLFPDLQIQNKVSCFSIKFLLHLSYDKYCISCFFTLHETKLHVSYFYLLIMVTLWNRADHYIFVLWFLLLSFFFSSPNLSGRRLDVCPTSTHGVALVRI